MPPPPHFLNERERREIGAPVTSFEKLEERCHRGEGSENALVVGKGTKYDAIYPVELSVQ